MKTIDEAKRILTLQYVLENLIETYQKTTFESDRYYIKLEVLAFIEEYAFNVSAVVEYMKLQEDKFEPFINLLSTVTNNSEQKTFLKPKVPSKVKVEVFSLE